MEENIAQAHADVTISQGSKPPLKKGNTRDSVGDKKPIGNDDAPLVHKKKTVQTTLTKQLPTLPSPPLLV